MNKELLGNIIKSRRLELNLSQRRLAALIKCDVKTISEIENGIRKKPKIKTLEKLSQYLLTDMDELLEAAGYYDEYDYEYEREISSNNKIVPFKYVITIIGEGVFEDEGQENVEKDLSASITDTLIETLGVSDDWDEMLENCDNCFVSINIPKRDLR